MKSSEIKEIESIIQYEFNNKMLLQQAFMFNPGEDENNPHSSEILRTIGKRTINFSTTQILMEYYGSYSKDSIFRASNGNAKVNDLLNSLYSKDIFARNIEILGLNKYVSIPDDGLLYDMNRRLFEAIVGAVTLDSKWNMPIVNDVISYILDIDYYLDNGFEDLNNHFVLLVYNWAVQIGDIPTYAFDAYTDESGNYIYNCRLYLPQVDGYFEAHGNTKSEVRMEAAKQAYDFLIENNLIVNLHNIDIVPNPDKAVDQLKDLSLQGHFSMPNYDIIEDAHGYICKCSIDETEQVFSSKGITEDDAMSGAAYQMLLFVLGYEVE